MENLYSGTFERFAIAFAGILPNPPWVTSNVTHKTSSKTRFVKVWKHTQLPFQCTVKDKKASPASLYAVPFQAACAYDRAILLRLFNMGVPMIVSPLGAN